MAAVHREVRLLLLERTSERPRTIARTQKHFLGASLGSQSLRQRIIKRRDVQMSILRESRLGTRDQPPRDLLRMGMYFDSRNCRVDKAPS